MNIGDIPAVVWPLLAAALFLLVAVAGGRELVILTIRLGPLGGLARAFAGAVGTLLLTFAVYLSLPTSGPPPASSGARVSGVVLFTTFPSLPGSNYEIELLPNEPFSRFVSTTLGIWVNRVAVDPEFGEFLFPKTAGVRPGPHTLRLKLDTRIVYTTSIQISDDNEIVIEKTAPDEFSYEKSDLVNYFTEKHIDGSWQDRLVSIEHLAHLARQDPNVMERFLRAIDSDDRAERRLAAFVVGRACRDAARPVLTKIMNEDQSIYVRLRAAGYLSCPGTATPMHAQTFLYETLVCSEEPGYRITAAYYLFSVGQRHGDRCILDTLIGPGLGSDVADVPQEIRRLLAEYLYKRHHVSAGGWTTSQWREWWSENSGNYQDCNMVGPDGGLVAQSAKCKVSGDASRM